MAIFQKKKKKKKKTTSLLTKGKIFLNMNSTNYDRERETILEWVCTRSSNNDSVGLLCELLARKKEKSNKSFAFFPNYELELTEVSKDEKGKYSPNRWQRMNETMPDRDIFIDDNP